MTHRPALDGLRAVAALAVLATHVAFFTGVTVDSWIGPLTGRLNAGVAIFFALSGFLLYRPWAAAKLRGDAAPRPATYALRRLARIFPAYWLALLVLALALPDQVQGPFDGKWWVFWPLLQVYSTDTILGGIPIAWSLGTELTFYLLLPLLAAALASVRRPRTELLLLLASVPVAVVLTAVLTGDGPSVVPNTVLGKWPWFAVGLGLAVAHAAWADRPVPERPALARPFATHTGWFVAAAVVILVALAYGDVLPRAAILSTPGQIRLETVAFAVVGLCLLGPVVLHDPHRPSRTVRTLGSAPLAWLGLVSYGIFLWHYPIAERLQDEPTLVVALVTAGLTLAAATVSWYALERPVLRRVHRRRDAP